MPIEERLEKTQKEIESEIKVAMLEKNTTQSQLAEDLNLSKNVVSEAVRGYNTPRAKKASKKIRKWLGMENNHE